jgi:hypothetical protein
MFDRYAYWLWNNICLIRSGNVHIGYVNANSEDDGCEGEKTLRWNLFCMEME